ncbi:molybdopterin-binding protein [Kibdelosporangium philippinense]|uniref:Molybdopterin-binding protein n=1 Tax=Kibdelosporangium philippinense TaxID=211113 RepID=A0ABS8ZBD7_9PSEU|nr:molybdopterin-binding protein [Kibdelosporangium philippinense]MCE7004479.1 molybdopterin-binding protein [Kibdelosporangium philippinense]
MAGLTVTGAVRAPGTSVSIEDLDCAAQGPMQVHYVTRSCDRMDRVHGVEMHSLLSGIGLDVRNEAKMDHLMFMVRVSGQDGYQVVLSWAELDPEFGACSAVLATRYNGDRLPLPTLVMPRDGRGSRYVRMVSRLHVMRAV